MICTASGVAAAGQYANVGSVTAVDPFGTHVNASDPSHYFGTAPGIDMRSSPTAPTPTTRRDRSSRSATPWPGPMW